MDSLDLTNFITVEALKTFTGQVMVLVVLTQLVKELALGYLDGHLKWVALIAGLWVQIVVNGLNGHWLSWTLIGINGAIVALVAIKGAEMLKAKKEEKPINLTEQVK